MADLFGVNRTRGRRAADVKTGWAGVWAVARAVLIVAAVLGTVWLVYQLATLILLIIFSLLFAYLIEPLVVFVRRRVTFGRGRELSPAVAILLTYLASLICSLEDPETPIPQSAGLGSASRLRGRLSNSMTGR